MNIRRAIDDDIQAMSDLMIESIRETNLNDYSPEEIELTCENFTPQKVEEKMQVRDVFVFEREGVIGGTVSLEDNILHSLFVKPLFQGKDIGRKLVLHIENFAKTKNYNKLFLSSSITAKPFYQRLGYCVIRVEKRPFGSTWLMEKVLT